MKGGKRTACTKRIVPQRQSLKSPQLKRIPAELLHIARVQACTVYGQAGDTTVHLLTIMRSKYHSEAAPHWCGNIEGKAVATQVLVNFIVVHVCDLRLRVFEVMEWKYHTRVDRTTTCRRYATYCDSFQVICVHHT